MLNKYIQEFYIDPNSQQNIYDNLTKETPEREEEINQLIVSHRKLFENTKENRKQDENALDD